MVKDLVLKNRSYRRFYQEETISKDVLRELVDLARLSPSAKNAQPLCYLICNEPEKNAKIYKTLAWAGYLKEWGGPKEGERPSAYIVILGDKRISQTFGVDPGIVAQSILLGAVEKELGGCMIGTIKRVDLAAELTLPEYFEICMVIALGKPKEEVVIEPLPANGDIKYWRDEKQIHHVPKRSMEDVLIVW
jgi:nitroreductase